MKKILLTLIIALISNVAFSQSVTNIIPTVVDNKIELNYTISGIKYYQEVTAVKVFVSIDGGDFVGPLKELEGNTSEDIKNGKQTILWDVLKEIPFTDEDLVFDIRLTVTDKDRSRSFFVMLAGNDVTPIGLRVGMVGKTAWYVEVRGSLLAMNSPNYTYNNEAGIIDYDKPGYYETTGTGGWQAYSAIVGVTQQVMWNTFIYAGVGYGVENYVLEINNYNYNEPNSIGTDWAKNEGYSNAGVEIDGGLLLRYKGFVFGAGGTALNFKSFGWTASVGYNF